MPEPADALGTRPAPGAGRKAGSREAAPPVPALPILGWYESGRVRPLTLGLVLALALLALRFAAAMGSGYLPYLSDPRTADAAMREVRIGLVMALLTGFAPAAYGWAVSALRRDVAALRRGLPGPQAALAAVEVAAGRLERGTRWRAAWIGLALALATPLAVDREPMLYLDPDYWHPHTVLNWLQLPLLGPLLALTISAISADSRRLSEAAGRLDGVDLLDARAIAPFGHYALRVALLFVALPSLVAILVSDQGFAPLLGGLTVLAALLGGVAFLRPVRGIHRRIQREKAVEQARVRAALRGDRTALAGSPVQAWAGEASLADLLAWESRLEQVRAWPFDLPTAARFALFLLLPLGSWLGGALVERLLGRLLD